MNSLLNYGSDDDYEDSSEEKQQESRGASSKTRASSSRETDANYEEVQMELSEESTDSKPEPSSKEASRRRSKDRESKERSRRDRRDKEKSRGDHKRDRDRKSRRSSSRDRRRSTSRDRRRSSRHSRSRSRDRTRKYTKRHERPTRNQSERTDAPKVVEEERRSNDSDRFFMPGITGRFRDQIERRKQLWQKRDVETESNNGQSKKVWETTTFAQDADGRVANKFKRLMGIRGATQASGQGTDVLRKQEEMFSSMEQQYEVARTATHTMRGVGLGFGSYQR